ncbi:FUN14 family-domain-containing protein [Parasitella parasitica]|nr:FUN14 family-domain-containing protein [Parasitella parasitica]
MLRLPRIVNPNVLKSCARQNTAKALQMRQYSMLSAHKTVLAAPTKRVFDTNPLGASKMLALVTMTTASTSLFFKPSVQCQAAAGFNQPNRTFEAASYESQKIGAHGNKSIFNKGELTFGTFLGICTGFLVKKVGKIFAAFVGTGFVFLQYLSQQGYVTVHWDRLEGRYTSTLDADKDGKVSKRDLTSKWQKFVNLLTNNIQFKSTFLIGFYASIRYG